MTAPAARGRQKPSQAPVVHEADFGPMLQLAVDGLRADAVAVLSGGAVLGAVGAARGLPASVLHDLAAGREPAVEVPRLRDRIALTVPITDGGRELLVAFRTDRFSPGEERLVAALARAAGSVLGLAERARLLRRLTRIQHSISHRAPLQQVLDAITAGVSELIGDPVAGIRLLDPDDPRFVNLVSVVGVSSDLLASLRHGPVGEGAGGRALAEGRLVIVDDYSHNRRGLQAFREVGLHVAMAAPIQAEGTVVGSLTTASYTPGRSYSAAEQEALLAFAEGASLALTNARTLEAMREAQHAKDLFLAMVSHELKTPLTVIMATLRTLEHHREALPPERQTQLLRTAFSRGRDLERLMDQLLQGARAEMSTNLQPLLLPDLVVAALEGFDEVRSLRWGDIPDVTVRADPAGFRAVLGGLLENAVAHSPEGAVVDVAVVQDGATVRVAITNVGRLSPELDPADVFQPFRRGASASSSGVGLGLYIASRLADSMQARLTCTTGDNRVTFELHLPLEA